MHCRSVPELDEQQTKSFHSGSQSHTEIIWTTHLSKKFSCACTIARLGGCLDILMGICGGRVYPFVLLVQSLLRLNLTSSEGSSYRVMQMHTAVFCERLKAFSPHALGRKKSFEPLYLSGICKHC